MAGEKKMGVVSYNKLREVELSELEPEGWLRRYLENQLHGLTGHIEDAGYPFDTNPWGQRKKILREGRETWWPYEQAGYWVDGAIRCGQLLRDHGLIKKAGQPIDHVIKHAAADGFVGAKFLRKEGTGNRWVHAVFMRALMAQYSATGDQRVLTALKRHYLCKMPLHSETREAANIEEMVWTYFRTGDKRLLDLAVRSYKEYNRIHSKTDMTVKNMLSDERATEHGVTYNEVAKLGAILYGATGNRRWLNATRNAYAKVDRDHMLIDGVHSSSEHLHGKDPLECHETCDIADYTWSLGYLLMATGDVAYADKIERACFNAAPGAVRSDFRGLQYFSCPNQVVASCTSNHNHYERGGTQMTFRPNPWTECCVGEVNRIMPNYIARMWMRDKQGALVATMYGPGRITTRVGKSQTEVTVVEETSYPFGEEVDFQIRTPKPVGFPLRLRIPGWCRKARLYLNGELVEENCPAGTFVTVQRVFQPNDRLRLELPMELKMSRWPRGGIGIERGPLVYALRIGESWIRKPSVERQSDRMPAWNLYHGTPWNYALCLDGRDLKKTVRVVHGPMNGNPWEATSAPIELEVPARRVKGWRVRRLKRTRKAYPQCIDGKWDMYDHMVDGEFEFTPQLPEGSKLKNRLGSRVETVTLVPYGCTHLRVAVFPQAK